MEIKLQELNDKIETLQTDLKRKDQVIQEDYQQMQEQIKINQDLNNQIAYLQEFLEDQRNEISGLKYKIQQDERDKDSFKNKVESIQYFLESLMMKTRSVMEVFESVQQEKDQIMNEKQQLLMRASVGYEELTPRPSLEKICMKNNLEPKNILDPSLFDVSQTSNKKKVQVINYKKRKIPTIKLVNNLVLEIDKKNRIYEKQNKEFNELKKRLEQRNSMFTASNQTLSPISISKRRQANVQMNNGENQGMSIKVQGTSAVWDVDAMEKIQKEKNKTSNKNEKLIKNFDGDQEQLQIDIERQEFYQKTGKIIAEIKDAQQKLKDIQ